MVVWRLFCRHYVRAVAGAKIRPVIALASKPDPGVSDVPMDMDYVKENYRQMSAHDLYQLFNGMGPQERKYLVNSRIVDFVLLRQGAHMDQCDMKRMLIELLKLGVSREAYCFAVLSRLLQFKAHRLPLSDLLSLHRTLDNELSSPWAQQLREALSTSIRSAAKSVLFKPWAADVARLMSLGYETSAPAPRISSPSIAIDVMNAAWNMSAQMRSAMLARCREYLLQCELDTPSYAFEVLKALTPGQVPDMTLVDRMVTEALKRELTVDERHKLLELMRSLSVFDKRLLSFACGDNAEATRFKRHFRNCIDERLPSEDETQLPPRQTDFATGLCTLLTSQYEPLDEVDGAVSAQGDRGLAFLGKGDFVFGAESGIVLSEGGELKKRFVLSRLRPTADVLVVNCLDLDLDRAYAILRDIAEWEEQRKACLTKGAMAVATAPRVQVCTGIK